MYEKLHPEQTNFQPAVFLLMIFFEIYYFVSCVLSYQDQKQDRLILHQLWDEGETSNELMELYSMDVFNTFKYAILFLLLLFGLYGIMYQKLFRAFTWSFFVFNLLDLIFAFLNFSIDYTFLTQSTLTLLFFIFQKLNF